MKKNYYSKLNANKNDSTPQQNIDNQLSFDDQVNSLHNSRLKARLRQLAEKLRTADELQAEVDACKTRRNTPRAVKSKNRLKASQQQQSRLPVPVPVTVPVPIYNKELFNSSPQLADSCLALTPPQSPVSRRSRLPVPVQRSISQGRTEAELVRPRRSALPVPIARL